MKKNILIIDDNAKNIQLAANVLKSTELYHIIFALSAEDGFKKLENSDISLILLDINMPVMDGYEAADIIKADPKYSKIPIIFLSANANQESINLGFEHGGADYITKPFQELELLHRVKTHVELFESRRELEHEVEDSNIILEQYKMAMDASLMVIKSDLDGTICYVNEKFCMVSKYSLSELLGRDFELLLLKEKSDMYAEIVTTLKHKEIWHGSLETRAKDGSIFYSEATVLPIFNSEGRVMEYMGVLADTTTQVTLQQSIIDAQKEILYTFGELSEMRSQETGEHVKRVSLVSELLARKSGCSHEDVELIKIASPMHDIGKVIIPDEILLKPGRLTNEEFEIMKKHSEYGYEIFRNSPQKILQSAAIIAHEHHERYDGNGYPQGLKGEEISRVGRIVAIVDVFDALMHDRIYKSAWSLEETLEYIQNEKSKAFDPELVDIFIENIDEVIAINEKFNR